MPPVNPGRILAVARVLVGLGVVVLFLRSSAAASREESLSCLIATDGPLCQLAVLAIALLGAWLLGRSRSSAAA